MNKEDNLKMVIPEIEPLQKKQQDEEPTVYQPCSVEKKINLGDIKLQVLYFQSCYIHLDFVKVTE